MWLTPRKVDRAIGTVNGSDTISDPTSGSVFKTSGDSWQFNWKTDELMVGCRYRIGALLDDGTTNHVDIIVRLRRVVD